MDMRRALQTVLAAVMVFTGSVVFGAERVYYVHNDHLGTPVAMTDETGVKVWEAEYLPFGQAVVDEDPDGDQVTVENNIRFPGQYYDAETGLHYNYFRSYDPLTGRYLEADPIGIEGGMNHLYVYAQNNSINFIDPFGWYAVCPSVVPPPPTIHPGTCYIKMKCQDGWEWYFYTCGQPRGLDFPPPGCIDCSDPSNAWDCIGGPPFP